jgi:hypothetical protein
MAISPEEAACRRRDMQDALTNARLEGLEPDPIFFEYADRYVQGEISLAEAVADYIARLTTTAQPTQAR